MVSVRCAPPGGSASRQQSGSSRHPARGGECFSTCASTIRVSSRSIGGSRASASSSSRKSTECLPISSIASRARAAPATGRRRSTHCGVPSEATGWPGPRVGPKQVRPHLSRIRRIALATALQRRCWAQRAVGRPERKVVLPWDRPSDSPLANSARHPKPLRRTGLPVATSAPDQDRVGSPPATRTILQRPGHTAVLTPVALAQRLRRSTRRERTAEPRSRSGGCGVLARGAVGRVGEAFAQGGLDRKTRRTRPRSGRTPARPQLTCRDIPCSTAVLGPCPRDCRSERLT